MMVGGGATISKKESEVLYVYRISTAAEWDELQNTGVTFGGDLDKSTKCFHLSNLNQVQSTLQNFFLKDNDLYLLQIDANKLGDGLIYESFDHVNESFPHFYGPSRSFSPLSLDVVTKAEKLTLSHGKFTCTLLA